MLNVGIIGLGGVGEVLLQAFQKHPETNVTYLFDSNQDRLLELSERYDIPWATRYDDILEEPTIDLVYLAVPPKFHHAIALDILKSGKHIFCEKPLANSLEEAQEIVATLENSRGKHVMNFPTIYRPAFQKMKEYFISGMIGASTEVKLKATFEEWPRPWQQNNWISTREQGGFVKEVFPHYIQMISDLIGDIKVEESKLIYPEDATLSEVAISAIGKAHGLPLSFHGEVDNRQKEEISFTIIGSLGTLTLFNWRELFFTPIGRDREPINLEPLDHLQVLINSILSHLDGDMNATVVTFHDGLKIQGILEDLVQQGS